jgi:hypothetical protein
VEYLNTTLRRPSATIGRFSGLPIFSFLAYHCYWLLDLGRLVSSMLARKDYLIRADQRVATSGVS